MSSAQTNNRMRITVRFADNQEGSFLVDTGAVASLMNHHTLKKLAPIAATTMRTQKEAQRPSHLMDFNVNEVRVMGQHTPFISFGDWNTEATFNIVEAGINVIGMDVLPKLGFKLQQAPKPKTGKTKYVTNPQTNQWTDKSVKALFNAKYANLFTRVGRVKHHRVRTRFIQHFKAIQQKGRRIPFTIQPQVEAEIRRLITEGHIEKLHTCTAR